MTTSEYKRKYMKMYWQEHREEHRQYMKAYYARNKDKRTKAQNDYFRRNMELYENDGLLLYEHRRGKQLLQKHVAKMIGVTPATISNWELGKTPINWSAVFRVFPELRKEAEEWANRLN